MLPAKSLRSSKVRSQTHIVEAPSPWMAACQRTLRMWEPGTYAEVASRRSLDTSSTIRITYGSAVMQMLIETRLLDEAADKAGITDYDWIHWYREHPPEDDLKLLKWSDEQCGGQAHVDWYPFQHPQLGAVESLNVSVAAGMLLYEAVRQRGQ